MYILEGLDSEHYYIGITDDLRTRLAKHNAGAVPHTSKFRPWRLKTYIAFSDEKQAIALEKYLKSGSGRAFAKSAFSASRQPPNLLPRHRIQPIPQRNQFVFHRR
jgi:putative endonuclease